jgi:hypothetical protein
MQFEPEKYFVWCFLQAELSRYRKPQIELIICISLSLTREIKTSADRVGTKLFSLFVRFFQFTSFLANSTTTTRSVQFTVFCRLFTIGKVILDLPGVLLMANCPAKWGHTNRTSPLPPNHLQWCLSGVIHCACARVPSSPPISHLAIAYDRRQQ